MKIIHVAGFSDTGKTRFVTSLIGALREQGTVGVVKHIGHHRQSLPEGKDTTLFYAHGADIVVGIDNEKALAALRKQDLSGTLAMLARAGIRFAVIEGFKTEPFPKIIFGDFEDDTCVLRNPDVGEVLASLDLFFEYETAETLLRKLRQVQDAGGSGALLLYRGVTGEEETGSYEGLLDIRLSTKGGGLPGETCIAVLGRTRAEAFSELSRILEETADRETSRGKQE
ncbi:MAG: molybdopterin-guanine dinucleotide biosynthesis protein B [Methanomicrobiaceae archaeon]|nr:molybdopterin-guanine dinucleotide biosynthesis protein B [Methanomicrobiaceae archaeon]